MKDINWKERTNLLFLFFFFFHKFASIARRGSDNSHILAKPDRIRSRKSISRSQIGHFPPQGGHKLQAILRPSKILGTPYHRISNNWMVTGRIRLAPTLTNAIFEMARRPREKQASTSIDRGSSFARFDEFVIRDEHFRTTAGNSIPRFKSKGRLHFPPIFERDAILTRNAILRRQIDETYFHFFTLWVRIERIDNFVSGDC